MTDGPIQVNDELAAKATPATKLRGEFCRAVRQGALALPGLIPDIAAGRLARDVSLANRVRSGRKQP
ncbi:hypothetical protein AE618_17830 [Bosea vaviloviae]|uniref:Uncharacterized protein n=1 Tax=Bosea vaviloviae TaxID=1526658 RepID=A0A0N1F3R0_9HYPH|nr:hypothetical protein AE618_17830 [Bosea vaviloviae]